VISVRYPRDLVQASGACGTVRGMTVTRTVSVTVKMSQEDWDRLERAAAVLWPGAIMTRSSQVLALVRQQVDRVLEQEPTTKKKSNKS
jgi:hypothetical protein